MVWWFVWLIDNLVKLGNSEGVTDIVEGAVADNMGVAKERRNGTGVDGLVEVKKL